MQNHYLLRKYNFLGPYLKEIVLHDQNFGDPKNDYQGCIIQF